MKAAKVTRTARRLSVRNRSVTRAALTGIVLVALSGLMLSARIGTALEAKKPKKPPAVTRANYAAVVSNPAKCKGARVDIAGKVFTTPEVDAKKGVVLQMYMDPKNSTWATIVGYGDPKFQASVGDYYRVVGTVTGKFTGKNALGATITDPVIVATSLTKVDATATASVAIRDASASPPIDQNGVVVTVTHVQFAADETRVFVTVQNNSPDRASFYSFEAKAVQGAQQFDEETVFDYPQVSSSILPGISSAGILVYPTMDPHAATRIVLEAGSDNYQSDFSPYSFDVAAG